MLDGAASPLKPRAALASLDANAMPSTATSKLHASPGKKQQLARPRIVSPPPLAGRKRAAGDDDGRDTSTSTSTSNNNNTSSPRRLASPNTSADATSTTTPGSKPCLEPEEDTRSRSHSPAPSSVFDTSTADGDSSWATTTTDPDIAESIAAPRPRGLTREQAREKAEILRLRLGLASYKLRTGQTGLSLADLQAKPLPPARRVRIQGPEAEQQQQQQREPQVDTERQHEDDASSSVSSSLPSSQSSQQQQQPSPPPPASQDALSQDTPAPGSAHQTPVRKLTAAGGLGEVPPSSGLRGGAANGLLSLARGDVSSLA